MLAANTAGSSQSCHLNLFCLQRDCPSLPAGSYGSLATHRGPIKVGGGRQQGGRQRQVKSLCGRGGLSFTVIQVLSGWRRGKVKWRGAPWLSSVSPRTPPITGNGWLGGDLRVGGGVGNIAATVRYVYFAGAEYYSLSFLPLTYFIDCVAHYTVRGGDGCSFETWNHALNNEYIWILMLYLSAERHQTGSANSGPVSSVG